MFVAEIKVGDKTVDDVDKLSCVANVVKPRQVTRDGFGARERVFRMQLPLDILFMSYMAEICEEFRTGSGPLDSGGNPTPVTILTWLKRFNKQKPRSFEKATASVDAENWISHMEKIFDVMGCEDAFKTRLAVYKFEGNALAWWKAYKQAKGGDVWLITVTWVVFKELFFLQFFPRAEQERLKKEYL
nr:hypothetical protein [Tanacetum cinerariifolium]